MKIDFRHRSNLYLNSNHTIAAIMSMSVTNSHRPAHAYRKLPEFAIKHVDHNETFYTISERTDELFIVDRCQLLLNTI